MGLKNDFDVCKVVAKRAECGAGGVGHVVGVHHAGLRPATAHRFFGAQKFTLSPPVTGRGRELANSAGCGRKVSGVPRWLPRGRGRNGAAHAHRATPRRVVVGGRFARNRALDRGTAIHATAVSQLGRTRLRARENAPSHGKEVPGQRLCGAGLGRCGLGAFLFQRSRAAAR